MMRKVVFILVAVLVTISANAQVFDQGQLRGGVGLGLDTESSRIGLNFNAVYNFSERLESAVEFTHFFKKDGALNTIFDADAHWVFYDEGSSFNFYGLGGLCFNFYKWESHSKTISGIKIPASSVSDSDIGINIGIGASYRLSNNFNLAPQLRYTFSNEGFLRLGASLQYVF